MKGFLILAGFDAWLDCRRKVQIVSDIPEAVVEKIMEKHNLHELQFGENVLLWQPLECGCCGNEMPYTADSLAAQICSTHNYCSFVIEDSDETRYFLLCPECADKINWTRVKSYQSNS